MKNIFENENLFHDSKSDLFQSGLFENVNERSHDLKRMFTPFSFYDDGDNGLIKTLSSKSNKNIEDSFLSS